MSSESRFEIVSEAKTSGCLLVFLYFLAVFLLLIASFVFLIAYYADPVKDGSVEGYLIAGTMILSFTFTFVSPFKLRSKICSFHLL